MGDRVWAEISIGGDIARDHVGELAALLAGEFGDGFGQSRFVGRIEQAATNGETLTFEDEQVNYGRFGIEDGLEALGLHFDVRWSAGTEFDEGEGRHRPETGRRSFDTSGGVVFVPGAHARRAVEMLERGGTAEAVKLLRHALGEDVPPLPPLRIVGA